MTWSPGAGVDASIGLDVGYNEPVSLRLRNDGGALLVIGDSAAEIVLAQSHVAALHEQSAAVLGDLAALDAAEDQVATAQVVGDQASTTAGYARAAAEAAAAVGAIPQAQAARTAGDKAAAAGALVQATARAALDAMQAAEEAMDAAGEAAAAAHAAREAIGDDARRPSAMGRTAGSTRFG